MIEKNIFREYDIRGIYGKDLKENDAYLIGLAFGNQLTLRGNNRTIVGYDNRLSSEDLYDQLIQGLLDAGIDIVSIGLCLTPMVSIAATLYNASSYIMITASHNPKEYNGFKFSYNGQYSESGDTVKELYQMIVNQKLEINLNQTGSLTTHDFKEEYTKLLLSGIKLGNRKLKVVYDCGNGTTSNFAPEVFNSLNIEAIPLYSISNGSFPNHHPDPSVAENLSDLSRKVTECQADVGIAFDGDGDRVGVVDETGRMVDVDKYMIIIWRDIYNKIKNKKGLLDIKCSRALEDELIKLNIEPIWCRTGASYTQRKVLEDNIPFGGELSGHVYFLDRFIGAVDGIYGALRLIEILSKNNKTVTEHLEGINKYCSTKEIKIKTPDDIKFSIIQEVLEYVNKEEPDKKLMTIDGVRIIDNDSAVLVRASNTGPNITMRFEAKSEEKLQLIKLQYETLVNQLLLKNTDI